MYFMQCVKIVKNKMFAAWPFHVMAQSNFYLSGVLNGVSYIRVITHTYSNSIT